MAIKRITIVCRMAKITIISPQTWIISAIITVFVLAVYNIAELINSGSTTKELTDKLSPSAPQTYTFKNKAELLQTIKTQYPLTRYKFELQQLVQQLQDKMTNVDLLEVIVLKRELIILNNKIADLGKNYAKKIELLADIYIFLTNHKELYPSLDYNNAVLSTLKGDTLAADEWFTHIINMERMAKDWDAISRAAEAAYFRGNIALENINYLKTYRHFRKAVMLNPNELRYLVAAGDIADNMALYANAVNYYGAALHILQHKMGKPAKELRSIWNKLGSAHNGKGDPDKAIEYFELSLQNDSQTYDAVHIYIAEDKNNLGWAWENKGELNKAINYYEEALKIYTTILGTEHTSTIQVKDNLLSTTELLSSHQQTGRDLETK